MEHLAIPKNHTIFRFRIPQPDAVADFSDVKPETGNLDNYMTANALVFEIHGDSFEHRATDRATKKFKQRNMAGL